MATTENWRNRVAIGHPAGDGVQTWSTPRVWPAAASSLSRREGEAFLRRDVRRAVTAEGALWTSYGVTLESMHPGAGYLSALADAAADPASGATVDGGVTTWKVGDTAALPRRHVVDFVLADGAEKRLSGAILTTWQITVERRAAVRHATEWRGLGLDDHDFLAVAEDGVAPATNLDVTAVVGDDMELPVFALVVVLTRDVLPAGFGPDGIPTCFDGRMQPDITGRLLCRLDEPDFSDALSGRIDMPLELSIAAPDATFTLTLPETLMRAERRRLKGSDLYEHDLYFTARLGAAPAEIGLALA